VSKAAPLVGIVMGSQSDWPTLARAASVLDELGVAAAFLNSTLTLEDAQRIEREQQAAEAARVEGATARPTIERSRVAKASPRETSAIPAKRSTSLASTGSARARSAEACCQ